MVENHNDPESLTELSNTFTIMNLLDHMPTRLKEMIGVLKVVPFYGVQDDPTLPVLLPRLQPNLMWSLKNIS